MLRLESLDPRAATAICARCHGSPTPIGDYRPADTAQHIALLDDKPGVFPDGRLEGQLYQARGFVSSRCFLEGDLTCGGCHDSHGPGLRSPERRDGFCLGCHVTKASGAHTHHKPEREGSSCIECHMPRLLTGLMVHQREHRITNPMPWLAEPDACTTAACHGDKGKAWAIEATETLWGAPPTERLEEIRAISLARSNPRLARPGLRKALKSTDPFIRGNAAVRLHDAAAMIDDPVAEVRYLAARGGAPRGEPGIEVLTRFLQDSEPLVRAVAAIRLAERDQPLQPERKSDLQHFIRHYPNATPVRVQLAEWQNQQGEHSAALVNLTMAIAHAPYQASYWAGLAEALRGLGRHQDASAASVRWAELAVSTLLRSGQKDEARRLLQQALADAPPGPNRQELEEYLELIP